MTSREALTRGASRLDASAQLRDSALADATLLLLHVLGSSRAALIANYDRVLTAEQQAAYEGLISRRLAYEPIQYITGEQEFYGLGLGVTRAVLIPRPETEQLVEAVLAEVDAAEEVRVLDVGTGSGAIAIALACHLQRARITAVDVSRAALDVAAANAERHGVAGRIRFMESDLLAGLAPGERFDVIAANPPYVPAQDCDELHPQVADFEPAAALFAGEDGLDVVRRLIPQARAALVRNGLLAMEIGHGQRDAVEALLDGWNELRFVDDLGGVPRVVVARRR